jgi:hypothetical protein
LTKLPFLFFNKDEPLALQIVPELASRCCAVEEKERELRHVGVIIRRHDAGMLKKRKGS